MAHHDGLPYEQPKTVAQEARLNVLHGRLDAEVPQLLEDLLGYLRGWRKAQHAYSAVVSGYELTYGKGWLADARASGDPRLQQAIAYTGYHRDGAHASAAILDTVVRVRAELRRDAAQKGQTP